MLNSHKEDEILVRVEPVFVEIWDTDEKNQAFQTFIDLKRKCKNIVSMMTKIRNNDYSLFMK